jgi:hypothetical protein
MSGVKLPKHVNIFSFSALGNFGRIPANTLFTSPTRSTLHQYVPSIHLLLFKTDAMKVADDDDNKPVWPKTKSDRNLCGKFGLECLPSPKARDKSLIHKTLNP